MIQLENVTKEYDLPTGKVGQLVAADHLTLDVPTGEVFGLVAAENMMRGHLLVTSDIGALAEVVGDTGLKFPTGDVEGLAACLEQVLESPGLVKVRRQQARERGIQLFSEGRMIGEHLALYRRLLVDRGLAC